MPTKPKIVAKQGPQTGGKARPAQTSAKPSPAKADAGKVTTARSTAKRHAARQATSALVAAATKISAADRTKAEALLAEIARRKERIAEDFYDIGLAVLQISKKKLYLALGHKSFDDMLKARDVLSPTTARGLMQLVSTMSRDEALAYGQEKALALISYAKATPELDTPKTLMEGGALPDGKPFVKASVRDIKQAATKVRAAEGKSKPLSAEAKQAQAEVKAVAKWLRERGAAKPKVSEARAKDGYVIRVELPVAAWSRVRSS